MSLLLPLLKSKKVFLLATGGALLLASLLFLLIPATQMLPDERDEIFMMREVDMISIPPISNNPPPPQSEEAEITLEVDQLVPEVLFEQATNSGASAQEPALHALPLSYSPGGGDTVLMGAPLAKVETGVSIVGTGVDFSKIFSFGDLRENPRILHVPAVRYPDSLIRRGVRKGEVVLLIEIDPEGKARVERVISCSHAELESLAIDTVHRSRFTIPRIEGRAVRVKGRWPLVFHAPN